ncbi:hypothetical protein M8C21_024739 [Ambrosia artemisiifolia]|uniref:Uncharacterized protein n=1 Tax=Ambrosia artemisiifolia TaxID=4212 RepID=A0AAD5GSL1_AMBAR|nr:hypothetical protein M8C21_024739 [Ambrosia artemisiifolia]
MKPCLDVDDDDDYYATTASTPIWDGGGLEDKAKGNETSVEGFWCFAIALLIFDFDYNTILAHNYGQARSRCLGHGS